MELEKYVGKVIKVQIIKKKENYYIAKSLKENLIIYIEDEGDYLQEELIGMIEKCIIVKVQEENLIGFIMSNRKFINDMKKIDNNLKQEKNYKDIKDIYLVERLKINSKVAGLYLVDRGDFRNILFRYCRNWKI